MQSYLVLLEIFQVLLHNVHHTFLTNYLFVLVVEKRKPLTHMKVFIRIPQSIVYHSIDCFDIAHSSSKTLQETFRYSKPSFLSTTILPIYRYNTDSLSYFPFLQQLQYLPIPIGSIEHQTPSTLNLKSTPIFSFYWPHFSTSVLLGTNLVYCSTRNSIR